MIIQGCSGNFQGWQLYIVGCLHSRGQEAASFSGLCVKGFSSALVCFSLIDTVTLLTYCGFLDVFASGKLGSKSLVESEGMYWPLPTSPDSSLTSFLFSSHPLPHWLACIRIIWKAAQTHISAYLPPSNSDSVGWDGAWWVHFWHFPKGMLLLLVWKPDCIQLSPAFLSNKEPLYRGQHTPFCKGLDGNYLGLYSPFGLCCIYSIMPL